MVVICCPLLLFTYADIIANVNPAFKQKWDDFQSIVKANELTQNELILGAGVSQATVSRALARCPKKTSKEFERLCSYAYSMSGRATNRPVDDPDLLSAIREVWNGTPEHARALASMIRAAGVVARLSAG